MKADDLPFFLGLMRWLAEHGFPSATPIADRAGQLLSEVRGKPAAIVEFMQGLSVRRPGRRIAARPGTGMAWLHLAAEGYPAAPRQRPGRGAPGAALFERLKPATPTR